MRNPDLTTISPDVLHSIARLSALKVPGVHTTSPRRGAPEGVSVSVRDGAVDIELYLVMQKDLNLRQVGREVQDSVARAIEEMVGMVAGEINIHIEDIYYPRLDGQG